MAATDKDLLSGKFLAGNTWRFRPGQSGHPARYSYRSLRPRVIDYVQETLEAGNRLSWSGLAAYLGMSRPALDRYAKGEINSSDSAIVSLLEYFRTLIEAQLESMLTDKRFATQGAIRALEAHDRDRWKVADRLEVDKHETQTISLVLPESLATKLLESDSGITIEAIPDVED